MFHHPLPPDAELRILELRHAEELYELCDTNRQRLAPYLPWIDSTWSQADTREFIEQGLQQFAAGQGFHCGIWCEGEIAGSVGMHKIDWLNHAVSIGYWISREFEGRGLVTRAAAALTDHCLHDLGLHRVEIRCATNNVPSQRVAERLGFSREGILRGAQKVRDGWLDMVVFSKLAAD